MTLAPSEASLWTRIPREKRAHVSDAEINERYIRGEGRIVIETNREKLPGFVSLLKQPNYMDLRPFYQRRPRWKAPKQSLLIESFIMNIPVPPVFLYERDYNSYEVMDGQQRITALRDFYAGRFELVGLERWPEINGRDYQTLPDKIRQGLDGTVRISVCGRAVEHYAAMALMKRSPKITANWALAMVHSRGGI
ncbi:hypothetical protein SxD43FB_22105, partial [Sphingobium sp. D43FB]